MRAEFLATLWALVLCIVLCLIPRPALALPGPLILLPIMVASLPFFFSAIALILNSNRAVRPTLLRLGAIALLGFVASDVLGAILALLLTWRWGKPIRSVHLVRIFLTLVVLSFIPVPTPQPITLSMLPSGDAARAAPMPSSPMRELSDGGAVILHVGEAEEFFDCSSPSGYLLRPADLETQSQRLRELVASGPVIALGDPYGKVASRLTSLGIQLASIESLGSERICYRPKGEMLWKYLAPWRELANAPIPDVPGADFAGVPHLRPGDGAASDSQIVPASMILDTPTGLLTATANPIIIAEPNLALAAAAVRLWHAEGGTVSATVPQATPAQPHPLSGQQAALFVLFLTALSIVAVRFLRKASERRWTQALIGHRARWRRLSPHLPSVPLALVASLLGNYVVVPSTWGVLVTPTPWGGPPWLSVASLGGFALSWHLAFGRTRLMRWGVVFILPVVSLGYVAGTWPLPLHVLLAIPVLLAPCVDERWPRTGRHLVELRDADRVSWAGGKARRLALAVRRGVPVPPGVVLRPDDASASLLVARFPHTPLILRSSAIHEDDSPSNAGRFLTRAWLANEPRQALTTRLQEVSEACGGAVLVMPLVSATASGVVATDVAGGVLALLEEGLGTDGVTAGTSVSTRHWLGRQSEHVRSEGTGLIAPHAQAIVRDVERGGGHGGEWLLVAGTHVIVQVRPEGDAPLFPTVPDGAHEALSRLFVGEWLERSDADGLPDPAPRQTLELWASLWRRDAALGDAYRLLGLPRILAPRDGLVVLGGRLYGPSYLLRRLTLVALLKSAPRRLRRAMTRFKLAGARAVPDDELRRLAALSIAIRLVRPALKGEPASELVSRKLAADLAAGNLTAWPHRAIYDLDPASPRFGSTIPAPRVFPHVPDRVDRATCDTWSDLLLDQMARAVALLRREKADWGSLPDVAATQERYSMQSLEFGDAQEPEPGEVKGIWVSGGDILEGRVSFEPRVGTIWLVTEAIPALASRWKGCAAIVSSRGGPLAHLAMVARAEGFPALFSTKGLERLEEGDYVRIDSSGRILVMPPTS